MRLNVHAEVHSHNLDVKVILHETGIRGLKNDYHVALDVPLAIKLFTCSVCIIYAIVQQMWPSVWILVAMEGVLIMVTAGAGILDVLLEEAGICLVGLMKI